VCKYCIELSYKASISNMVVMFLFFGHCRYCIELCYKALISTMFCFNRLLAISVIGNIEDSVPLRGRGL